jgi:hypothetical protein
MTVTVGIPRTGEHAAACASERVSALSAAHWRYGRAAGARRGTRACAALGVRPGRTAHAGQSALCGQLTW